MTDSFQGSETSPLHTTSYFRCPHHTNPKNISFTKLETLHTDNFCKRSFLSWSQDGGSNSLWHTTNLWAMQDQQCPQERNLWDLSNTFKCIFVTIHISCAIFWGRTILTSTFDKYPPYLMNDYSPQSFAVPHVSSSNRFLCPGTTCGMTHCCIH